MKSLILYPNNPMQFSLPHSIAQLSACAKVAGDEVGLFDTTYYRTKEKVDDIRRMERGNIKPFEQHEFIEKDVNVAFQEKIDKFQPDRILVSVVDNTKRLAWDLINKMNEHIHTVIGGVSPIISPYDFKADPAYNEVCTSTATEFFGLSEAPFDDWTVFPEERMHRPMDGKWVKTLPFMLEYGCPYNCGYCCAPVLRNKCGMKKRTIKKIREELKWQVYLHEPEFVYFSSESFLSTSNTRLNMFSKFYKTIGLPFWCQSHVNTLSSERIQLLREMNCHRVGIGIECGNEKYRKDWIGKDFSNENAVRVFKELYDAGVHATANNIIGLPFETPDMMLETIMLNQRLLAVNPDMMINCYIFQPYKGTMLRRLCEGRGLMLREPDTILGDPCIENPYISNADIVTLRNEFVRLVRE
jgi:radical SAM superfamily enzyme YgiQ (UPF0313 family)